MNTLKRPPEDSSRTLAPLSGSLDPFPSLVRRGARPLIALGLLLAAAHADDNFDLARWTIDGGGDILCAGGDFELSGTLGQPDAGLMSGGDFQLAAGFWFPAAPGDCNIDGTTDLIDFQSFHSCVSGPRGGATPGCNCYDIDEDGDIDLSDVASFQRTFDGG